MLFMEAIKMALEKMEKMEQRYNVSSAGKLIGSYGCATETSMRLDTDLLDTGRIARLRPGQSISVRSDAANPYPRVMVTLEGKV